MATIGNAPVFPTQSVLPGNLQVTGNATVSGNATINGTTNSVGALTENSNEVLNVTNTTFFGVDIWYLTANATNSSAANKITSNWARLEDTNTANMDSGTVGVIGNAMSESSGVFTFPSTGKWRLDWHPAFTNLATSGTQDLMYPIIWQTVDNFSTEGRHFLSLKDVRQTSTESHTATTVVDIQDVSNYKVQFGVGSITNGYVNGDTNYMRSWVIFTKLGET